MIIFGEMNMDAPVGTIVTSMLEETQFQAQPHIGHSWVLAKGQVVAGTRYAAITGKTHLPDLRGVFLRSSNSDLTAADQAQRGNPENKKLGELQADEFKAHTHETPRPGGNDGNRSGQQDSWYGGGSSSTGSTGGTETRPRNVTVNFFIKIN
jgi:hypothetical protein